MTQRETRRPDEAGTTEPLRTEMDRKPTVFRKPCITIGETEWAELISRMPDYKILIIKLYMAVTGLSSAQAKAEVEEIERFERQNRLASEEQRT